MGGCARILGGPGGESDTGWSGTPVAGAADTKSIKEKFGVTLDGSEGVDAAFHELSAYIQKGGLDSEGTVIKTGDWIDLDGGLTVAEYLGDDKNGGGGFSYDGEQATEMMEYEGFDTGPRCRVIVVGINSFQANKGWEGQYVYQGEEPPPAHVVFQFLNILVERRMNKDDDNTGGYEASEMRKYLVPVEGDGGNFLAGLVSAGVPDGVLWAPARALSKGNYMGFVILRDKLWLPTEREMLPKGDVNRNFFSQNGETVENQAWLEYYDDDYRPSLPAHPPKIGGETSNNFWEGSASTGDKFCIFDSSWCSIEAVATAVYGVVPAFCVQ